MKMIIILLLFYTNNIQAKHNWKEISKSELINLLDENENIIRKSVEGFAIKNKSTGITYIGEGYKCLSDYEEITQVIRNTANVQIVMGYQANNKIRPGQNVKCDNAPDIQFTLKPTITIKKNDWFTIRYSRDINYSKTRFYQSGDYIRYYQSPYIDRPNDENSFHKVIFSIKKPGFLSLVSSELKYSGGIGTFPSGTYHSHWTTEGKFFYAPIDLNLVYKASSVAIEAKMSLIDGKYHCSYSTFNEIDVKVLMSMTDFELDFYYEKILTNHRFCRP